MARRDMQDAAHGSLLHGFLFEGLAVRGALLRLDADWQALLARRSGADAYPPALRDLLGQMSAAALLLQASIRFDGALVVQVQGDGPVPLMVVEVQSDLSFRATAKRQPGWSGAAPPGPTTLEALLDPLGNTRAAITLDARDRAPGQQPYQGLVSLRGDDGAAFSTLAQVFEGYMRRSEQLDTRFVLAADGRAAAGLLVQRLPVAGERNLGERDAHEGSAERHEDFERIAMLAATATPEELLTLAPDALLHRLFWQEPLRRFEPRAPRFACRCSRERVRALLLGLGREDCEALLAERGGVEVGCDFCGLQYRFDAVDVGRVFTPEANRPPRPGGVQ